MRMITVRKLDHYGRWQVLGPGGYFLAAFGLREPLGAVGLSEIVPGVLLEDINAAVCAARRALRAATLDRITDGLEFDARYVEPVSAPYPAEDRP